MCSAIVRRTWAAATSAAAAAAVHCNITAAAVVVVVRFVAATRNSGPIACDANVGVGDAPASTPPPEKCANTHFHPRRAHSTHAHDC